MHRPIVALAVFCLVLGATAAPAPRALSFAEGTGTGEVVVELRVWQHVDDAEDTWISARPRGGRWDTLGTIPFPLDETDGGITRWDFHSFRDLTVSGAELRVWQRYRAPELIYVRACVTPCSKFGVPFAETDPRGEVPEWELWPWQTFAWNPLGMVPLHFDGQSRSGRYRYADRTVAMPVGNPGQAADREHLLALRDALAGTATLNWDAGTPTSEWEGVTVSGTPSRVTGLILADRGLDGEILGWLGELTELRELRLDGNQLTGPVPTKLAALPKLTQVGLAGNALEGCVPPPLRDATSNDLASLGLPECAPPALLIREFDLQDRRLPTLHFSDALDARSTGGTYRWGVGGGRFSRWDAGAGRFRTGRFPFHFIVLDLLPGREFRIHTVEAPITDIGPEAFCPPCAAEHVFEFSDGVMVTLAGEGRPGDQEVWVLLSLVGDELGRSHYAEDDPAAAAILDRIVASLWTNRAVGDDGGWVWP